MGMDDREDDSSIGYLNFHTRFYQDKRWKEEMVGEGYLTEE